MQRISCTDLGLTVRDLESHLVSSGYWASDDLRARNACTLSPGALGLSPHAISSLDTLARETYSALAHVNQRLMALTSARSLSNADAAFVKMARRAARDLLNPGETGDVPPVIKLDLVIDTERAFKIVEVDAYNPRGYGYLALLDALVPQTKRVGTGIGGLARIMKESSGSTPWTILVSEHERYYAPAFGILARTLADYGVAASIARESDFDAGKVSGRVFVIPDTLHVRPQLRTELMTRYREGALGCFYPPVAYLGTKALLPSIREAGAAAHMPRTALVSRTQDPRSLCTGTLLLKGVVSSGMKQVVFSDIDSEEFAAAYAQARSAKSPQWVMQEAVEQEPFEVPVYTADGARVRQSYYLRVIAYATRDGLLGAEVTGRPDKRVHGAPDCIQIPVMRI